MKKLGMVITCLAMILLLVSCANKRKDLVLSNFPSIQNEDLSSSESILSQKSNWTVGINGIITDYYVYKLKDGKSVIVFLSKGKVVAITRKGIDYN